MHDEVDGELFGRGIDPADRVGAKNRPGLLRHDLADLDKIKWLGISRVGVEEHELHVAIGGDASRLPGKTVVPRKEGREALATEDDALHVRRQSLGADNLEFYWMGLAHAV